MLFDLRAEASTSTEGTRGLCRTFRPVLVLSSLLICLATLAGPAHRTQGRRSHHHLRDVEVDLPSPRSRRAVPEPPRHSRVLPSRPFLGRRRRARLPSGGGPACGRRSSRGAEAQGWGGDDVRGVWRVCRGARADEGGGLRRAQGGVRQGALGDVFVRFGGGS